MEKIFNCPQCSCEMTIDKKFETKPRGVKKKKYRVRRFYCKICDIYETIFADGFKELQKV
jgi:transcription elongation factor Elf1